MIRKGRRTLSTLERAIKKIGPPTETGCRPWLGTINKTHGVPRLNMGNEATPINARRLLWECANGPIPDDCVLVACKHRTDCVWPSHQTKVHKSKFRPRSEHRRKDAA